MNYAEAATPNEETIHKQKRKRRRRTSNNNGNTRNQATQSPNSFENMIDESQKQTDEILNDLMTDPKLNQPFVGNQTTVNHSQQQMNQSIYRIGDSSQTRVFGSTNDQYINYDFEKETMEQLQSLRLENKKLQQSNITYQSQLNDMNQRYIEQEQKIQEIQLFWESKHNQNLVEPNKVTNNNEMSSNNHNQSQYSTPRKEKQFDQTANVQDPKTPAAFGSNTQYTNINDIARANNNQLNTSVREGSYANNGSPHNQMNSAAQSRDHVDQNKSPLNESALNKQKIKQTEQLILQQTNIPVRVRHYGNFHPKAHLILEDIVIKSNINSKYVVLGFTKSGSGKYNIGLITPIYGGEVTTGEIIREFQTLT